MYLAEAIFQVLNLELFGEQAHAVCSSQLSWVVPGLCLPGLSPLTSPKTKACPLRDVPHVTQWLTWGGSSRGVPWVEWMNGQRRVWADVERWGNLTQVSSVSHEESGPE